MKMLSGQMIRILVAMVFAGALGVAEGCIDSGPKVGKSGNTIEDCGDCERLAVKCEGENKVVCVTTIKDLDPSCIAEFSKDCSPAGGSGGPAPGGGGGGDGKGGDDGKGGGGAAPGKVVGGAS